MAKPRIPSQKKNYAKLNQRLAGYVEQIKAIYDDLNKRASSMALSVGFSEGEFLFSNYPELKERLFNLQKQFVNDIGTNIYSNTSKEWKNSNLVQDLLARKVLSFYTATAHGNEYEKYFETNSDALKAFQKRKDNGMNLSAKLWNQAENYKVGLETAISTAIQKGTSAITLSKRVSQYLNDFPSLQADYTDKFGHAAKAKDCQYASIRLARSEINMAYRTAEQTRWRQFDFILGYEIKLSKKHPAPDICDDLIGKYPKDFVWTGWHPNDMCYAIPIIASEDEYWSDKPLQYVDNVPDGFKDWVAKNQPRISQAEKRGTLPYFLRDNMDVVRKIIKEDKAVL